MIKASLKDDNDIISIDFDVTAWFEQATDDQIVALAKSEWGYDYEADAVADYFFEKDENVTKFFTCLRIMQEIGRGNNGFACAIDDGEAIKWVTEHRPHLLERMGN